jgi:hypothetical protein
MLDVLVRIAESPCFAPLRILTIGGVTGLVVMLMGDFLYSRRAIDQERKRRFVTTGATAFAFFGASFLFMLAEACALGTGCSDPLEINCRGQAANVYQLAGAVLSFTALAIMCTELVRQLRIRG